MRGWKLCGSIRKRAYELYEKRLWESLVTQVRAPVLGANLGEVTEWAEQLSGYPRLARKVRSRTLRFAQGRLWGTTAPKHTEACSEPLSVGGPGKNLEAVRLQRAALVTKVASLAPI